MEVFVGRQPIFDAQEQVVGYELLYRTAQVRTHSEVNGDDATTQVLANALLSIGIDEVAKGKLCFVNFTENLLMGPLLDYLTPEMIGIEVLEDVPITPALVNRLAVLKARGFKISMDDFVVQQDVTLYDELFRYIDFVKVDFLTTTQQDRRYIEHFVRDNHAHIQLIAERLETRNQFDLACRDGYSMFQGFFFEQPQLVKSYEIPINTMQYLQVLALLKDRDVDINELALQIERDVSLSFKLMQFIRMSDPRIRRKVSSIKQAIVMLGTIELQKWMYLLAIREMKNMQDSGVFQQLMIVSLFRARVCEQLARKHRRNHSEYFLVGMFSLIDSLLQRPLQQILMQMPLEDAIVDTLIGVETPYSPFLKFSTALGKLKWEEAEKYYELLRIKEEDAQQLYDDAMNWAENAVHSTMK
ncbi:MAG: HDOD domain-containing protein [Caryophanon sp.]|nr:HDOD domain-containing protein [Caryophanon sp.]